MWLVDLLESVGRLFVAQGGKDRAPIIRAELVDDIGDVGRMQLGQFGVGDSQLDRAHVAANRVDRFPGDELLWPVEMEGRGDPPAEPFERNASGQTAAADIDAD